MTGYGLALAGCLAFSHVDLEVAECDFASARFAEDGGGQLAELEARAFLVIPEALRGQRFSPVDLDCRWIAIHEGIDAARRSPDRAAYNAARSTAQTLVAQAEERAGAPDPDAAPVARLAAAAHADRIWTGLWYETPRTGPDQVLIFEHMEALASQPRCEARQAAIAALDALIAQEGWPAVDQARLAADITQTVQHAGRRSDLRQAALDWAAEGIETGGPEAARRYALLADRFSLIEAGAQLYGTQGRCEAGVWIALPMLDDAQAERWRTEHGLEGLADHAEAMSAACG